MRAESDSREGAEQDRRKALVSASWRVKVPAPEPSLRRPRRKTYMRGSTVRFSLLGLGAACVLALGSAAAQAGSSAAIKNGGTLTVGLADEPDALDPTVARTFSGRIVF